MDVINAEQARIAEEAGACAVMALERVPADIRKHGSVLFLFLFFSFLFSFSFSFSFFSFGFLFFSFSSLSLSFFLFSLFLCFDRLTFFLSSFFLSSFSFLLSRIPLSLLVATSIFPLGVDLEYQLDSTRRCLPHV